MTYSNVRVWCQDVGGTDNFSGANGFEARIIKSELEPSDRMWEKAIPGGTAYFGEISSTTPEGLWVRVKGSRISPPGLYPFDLVVDYVEV